MLGLWRGGFFLRLWALADPLLGGGTRLEAVWDLACEATALGDGTIGYLVLAWVGTLRLSRFRGPSGQSNLLVWGGLGPPCFGGVLGWALGTV